MKFSNKSFYRIVYAVLAMFMCTIYVRISASAVLNANDIKLISEKWQELRDYPIMPGDEGWEGLGYDDVLRVLNPPEEVLSSLSTRELAELMLRWPLLDEMYGTESEKYFQLLAGKCTIFEELRWRKGGTEEILYALRDAPFDIETVLANGGSLADEFVYGYVSTFGNEFTDVEAALYRAVWNERNEKYYSMLPESVYGISYIEISKENKKLLSASELWETWRECREYPIRQDDDNWDRFDDRTRIRILNPPDDVLMEMTTEELASLVLSYPFLRRYMFYDSARQYFNSFMERNCKVFKELIGRNDGTECLLKAYEVNSLDIEELNENGLDSENSSVVEEIFICKYIDYYGSWRFQEADVFLYGEIYKKKSATIYAKIKDEEVRKAFDTTLSKATMDESSNPGLNEGGEKTANTENVSSEKADNEKKEDVMETDATGKESDIGRYYVLATVAIAFIFVVTLYLSYIIRRKKH